MPGIPAITGAGSAGAWAPYAPPHPAADLCVTAGPGVAPAWRALAEALAAQETGNPGRMQAHVDRQVADLGLAFRIAGEGEERSWPLGPMPLLIGAAEWQALEAGLVQRARLLEAVVADIHGPQRLIAQGHLPAAVVAGSARFVPQMVGLTPPGGQFLYALAIDLARGAGGEWRVLADRVRLPIGIGYALENRMALARATGGLLPAIGVRRLSDFFETLRAGIAARCRRSDPRIGLLTPGRFHQSYPEQAHLARHLGFSLVEGADLVVSEGRLYVRTIAGLKRIDALWRWINTADIDPLAFDPGSTIGVPDLASAWNSGELVMANWPGAGAVESRAMAAFIPRLAPVMLGEELALPNLATWWCGQAAEHAHAIAHLDSLAIGSAFRTGVEGLGDGTTRMGNSFSGTERDRLLGAMARRPMDYAAQEIVQLSTTPCLIEGALVPRPFTLRAFLARDAAGEWTAMPGGFARVSAHGDLRHVLMGAGDISADVCVVEAAPSEKVVAPVALAPPPLRRGEGLLPSRAADNLFWLGRYCERGQMTARIIRALLDALPGGTSVARLADLLARLDAAPANAPAEPVALAKAALASPALPGSLERVLSCVRHIGRQLRDRLTPDSRRVLNRPLPGLSRPDGEALAGAANRLIERFAAAYQLLSDHMSRTPAFAFFDMGRALERASLAVQATRAIIPGSASADDLSALLGLFDAEYLYRSRYLTMPFIAPVLDLVLLDARQPRSLAFQLETLAGHLAALPALAEDGLPDPPLRHARRLVSEVEAMEAEAIDEAWLETVTAGLFTLSDAIAERFFHMADRPDPLPGATLLA